MDKGEKGGRGRKEERNSQRKRVSLTNATWGRGPLWGMRFVRTSWRRRPRTWSSGIACPRCAASRGDRDYVCA
ncbi:hypothetical protein PUN28_007665 [Cardiocondyla obscurior]|uniref:Uncharacterized protein n=1 Tax=Cardiocondyla obscurior TaxID=286306 RepID=A0AAW2G6N9_9HYME